MVYLGETSLHYISKAVIRPSLAALALASVSTLAVQAQDAKPADPALANQLDPNDKSPRRTPN